MVQMIKQKTFNDYESDAYTWLDHMRHAFDVSINDWAA
jgi:hypothetical protein